MKPQPESSQSDTVFSCLCTAALFFWNLQDFPRCFYKTVFKLFIDQLMQDQTTQRQYETKQSKLRNHVRRLC